MGWWDRLRGGKAPAGTEPSVRSIRLNMPGWRLAEMGEQRVYWQDGDGDTLSLATMPGVLRFSDEQAMRNECRGVAEDRGGGLIEAAELDGPRGLVVMFIYKRLLLPAYVYTGILYMPLETISYVWTMVAGEHGTTGIREATVTVQLINEGRLTAHTYESLWAQDPYDPAYCGVDPRTLRCLSDDESYDAQFPHHPLSRVRRVLRAIPGSIEFDSNPS